MKKILIPTDFSLSSIQTINNVIQLFKNESCEFYLFNAYTCGTSGLNAIEMLQADDEWFEKPKDESLKQLGKLVELYTFKSNYPKHTFNAISECINLIEGIKNTILKIDADLVILSNTAEKTIGKITENILESIRTCPILIVPPHASNGKHIQLTIASDFKQKINTSEIEKFCKTLDNTNFEIGILVLEEQNTLSNESITNLESLITYLKRYSKTSIDLEYAKSSKDLEDYAISHLDDIICVIDKKPDLFRKIGLYKSNVISTLGQLRTNTVLTIHQ